MSVSFKVLREGAGGLLTSSGNEFALYFLDGDISTNYTSIYSIYWAVYCC